MSRRKVCSTRQSADRSKKLLGFCKIQTNEDEEGFIEEIITWIGVENFKKEDERKRSGVKRNPAR